MGSKGAVGRHHLIISLETAAIRVLPSVRGECDRNLPDVRARRLVCAAIFIAVLTVKFGKGPTMKASGAKGWLAIAGGFWIVMTLPVQAAFVADDTFASIPKEHLRLIMSKVSARSEQPSSAIFARLRAVDRGYCGYVNTTLEYEGFSPFFVDLETLRVEIGLKGKLPIVPRAEEPEGCH